MAAKTTKTVEATSVRELGRKAALAYVGAFGVAADEAGKLFERFVVRGERIEKDARKLMKQNEKQAREFATEVKNDQKANVARVKKAVKRAEKAIA